MLFICVGFETISSDNNLKMSLLEKALLNERTFSGNILNSPKSLQNQCLLKCLCCQMGLRISHFGGSRLELSWSFLAVS